MSALSDGEIVKGWFDPKNWGCGTGVLVVLAGITAGLVVAGHAAMGLL